MDGRLVAKVLAVVVVVVLSGFRIWAATRPDPEPTRLYRCFDTPVFPAPAAGAPTTAYLPPTLRDSTTPCD